MMFGRLRRSRKPRDEVAARTAQRESRAPRERPKNRRPLTPVVAPDGPTSPETGGTRRFNDQLQSPLFRLPPEIRQKIWSNVLGGHFFHIAHSPNQRKLQAIACTSRGDLVCSYPSDRDFLAWANSLNPNIRHLPWHGDCAGHQTATARISHSAGFWPCSVTYGRPLEDSQNANVSGFLRVCKRAYFEGTPILYGTNVFAINHPDIFVFMERSMLPQRLNLIRYLSFQFRFDQGGVDRTPLYDEVVWKEAGDIIAKRCTSLVEVMATLETTCDDERNDFEKWMRRLEALRNIKASRRFEVYVEGRGRFTEEIPKRWGVECPFTFARGLFSVSNVRYALI